MSDAKKMSQLISQSLRRELAESETNQVAEHLDNDEQSRKFAELSRVIQDSAAFAADAAPEGKSDSGPGLSGDVKQRMKDSLAAASMEKLSLSRSGLIGPTYDSSARVDETPEPHITRQVTSRFRLLRRLGEGGLGNVWLARDEKLNRTVAVKELNAESLKSPKAWQRFQREAEITGMLEHPNIVPIYQFGDDRKSAEPFYAMRFVGKRTLADAIMEHHDLIAAGETESLGLHRLLSVFLDICQAIAYAHSRGVVHRDLKPENVALDNFGQVIVLDWGLAKLVDDGELAHKLSDEVTLTDSAMSRTLQGDIVGTPLYMAPEQASGDLERINEKTDVYGLGTILFAMLTGDAPHARSLSTGSTDLLQALTTIAERDTPKPRTLRTSVPMELDAICAKAMAKKQHLRYGNVQQLAEAIERWMAGQSNKQAQYEAMRMEGRELRADLQSIVNDLERNVRFMSNLPPIQQLINVTTDEDIAVWRERLATIFQGLLEANPDYGSVVYHKIEAGQFKELVRVERHSRDSSRVRIVPRSRLREGAASDYMQSLLLQKPEECITSLVCDALCDAQLGCEEDVGLVAGIPVYDDQTEDSIGIVLINCKITEVLRRQLNRRFKSTDVVAACDIFHVMMRNHTGHMKDDSIGKHISEEAPHFADAVAHLQSNLEYIDDKNAGIYGARIWFIPNKHGLMYLLRRGQS